METKYKPTFQTFISFVNENREYLLDNTFRSLDGSELRFKRIKLDDMNPDKPNILIYQREQDEYDEETDYEYYIFLDNNKNFRHGYMTIDEYGVTERCGLYEKCISKCIITPFLKNDMISFEIKK